MSCKKSRKINSSLINVLSNFKIASNFRLTLTLSKATFSRQELDGGGSDIFCLLEDEDDSTNYKAIPWQPHNFDEHFTLPLKKEYTNFNRDTIYLDDHKQTAVLTDKIISYGLTDLDKSPYDLKYALCKCVLERMNLKDISAIRKYHYIQYLDISSNNLTNLTALSEMPYLQYLDASNNCIEKIFDFTAPFFLTYVNYSYNKIASIPDLIEFWSIVHLDLSHNCITYISGLDPLKFLYYLDLSFNNIEIIENLNCLQLETLIINNNILTNEIDDRISQMENLKCIKVIDLSFNKFVSLNFLEKVDSLGKIIMTDNLISDLMELYYLRGHINLKTLNLLDNKICENSHFNQACIQIIKNLNALNNNDITAEMRVEAWTKSASSQLSSANINKLQLILLDNINKPHIGPHVSRIDTTSQKILLIVGPPASRKKQIVYDLIRSKPNELVLGVSHTTRLKRIIDVEGKDYYFIKHDTFIEKVRRGEFIAVSEFNGHLYGIAYTELSKVNDLILIFFCDIKIALILKTYALHVTLVLALPRSEQTHLDWVKQRYFFEETEDAEISGIHIKHCPYSICNLLDYEKDVPEIDYDEEISLETTDDGNLIYKCLTSDTHQRKYSLENDSDTSLIRNEDRKVSFSDGTGQYQHMKPMDSKHSRTHRSTLKIRSGEASNHSNDLVSIMKKLKKTYSSTQNVNSMPETLSNFNDSYPETKTNRFKYIIDTKLNREREEFQKENRVQVENLINKHTNSKDAIEEKVNFYNIFEDKTFFPMKVCCEKLNAGKKEKNNYDSSFSSETEQILSVIYAEEDSFFDENSEYDKIDQTEEPFKNSTIKMSKSEHRRIKDQTDDNVGCFITASLRETRYKEQANEEMIPKSSSDKCESHIEPSRKLCDCCEGISQKNLDSIYKNETEILLEPRTKSSRFRKVTKSTIKTKKSQYQKDSFEKKSQPRRCLCNSYLIDKYLTDVQSSGNLTEVIVNEILNALIDIVSNEINNLPNRMVCHDKVDIHCNRDYRDSVEMADVPEIYRYDRKDTGTFLIGNSRTRYCQCPQLKQDKLTNFKEEYDSQDGNINFDLMLTPTRDENEDKLKQENFKSHFIKKLTNSSEEYEQNFVHDPAFRYSRKSVSTTDFIKKVYQHFGDHPILSVLSLENNLPVPAKRKTRYSTVAERISVVLNEKLESFYKAVLRIRHELLNMHWDNPGLFYGVIFTDDKQNTEKILHEIIECILTMWQDYTQIDENSILKDEYVKSAIKSRLKYLEKDGSYLKINY